MNQEPVQPPTKKYGDITIIPEISINKYNHYSPKLLRKFYNTVDQAGFNKHGFIFPNGKFAGLAVSHCEAQLRVEHLCKCGLDCTLYNGCMRVGYMDAHFDRELYVESLFVPTPKAQEAILDFIYSQKNIDTVLIDMQTNKLYQKRLKYIISKLLPLCKIL